MKSFVFIMVELFFFFFFFTKCRGGCKMLKAEYYCADGFNSEPTESWVNINIQFL